MKGGPTLMVEDVSRVVSGVLPLEALVCLRSGEWARDEARSALEHLDGERIKIAGLGGKFHPWRCRFYLDGSGCSIYAHRPAQCSALFCMDTGPLEDLLAREKPLDRADVLKALAGLEEVPGYPSMNAGTRGLLADIARAHEEQSPVRPILELAEALGFRPQDAHDVHVQPLSVEVKPLEESERADALAQLGEAARTDAAFRDLCVEQAGIPRGILPFLLGRSLEQLLAEIGLHPVKP